MIPIRTNVGWAGQGENHFRGHAISTLAGRAGFWSMVSLSVGHRVLEGFEERLLDELVVVMNASDPRIWPLKLAWLSASHGSEHAGVAAVHAMLDGAIVGPSPSREAAAAWLALAEVRTKAGVLAWFDDRKARGERVPGFGVPARAEDERVALIVAALTRHGCSELPHAQLLSRVGGILARSTNLRPNVVGALTACALDLGFSPAQCPQLVHVGLTLSIVANAVDSAAIRPRQLHRLPLECAVYEGRPPRRSPRARAMDEGGS